MVFDDEQKKRNEGESPPEGESKRDERRNRGSGAAAAAGAGGAGLGAGAAAGIVGGDDAIDAIRDRIGDGDDATQVDLDEVQSRISAAQEAARAATQTASIDVFDAQAEDLADALPSGVADAARIIGDALPPAPAAEEAADEPGSDAPVGAPTDGPAGERPEPDDLIPSEEDAPAPSGRPSIGRPQPEPGEGTEAEAPDAPEAVESEAAGDDAPPPPAAPGAPAPPSFPSPPSAESGGDDQVVAESPAPPAGPAPAPGAGASEDDDVAPPASAEPAGPDDASGDTSPPPVAGAPQAPSAPEPGTSDEPAPPVSGDSGDTEAPEDSEPAPSDPSNGSSDADDAPIASEPSAPSTPDTPSTPSSPGGSEAPSAPTTPGGSDSSSSGASEPTPPPSSGPDTGPPASPPSGPDAGPSPGGGPDTSVDYPYVYEWDDEGHWVDVAMQNDDGDVYYLRYYDNGSVYYLNEDGQYQPVEGDNLPHLLYVDDDGLAYFSKMQHPHNVYFSLDTHGDFDWVDYDDIPEYETPPYGDEYEYPHVVEYEYGDESWALVELEDGRMVKYYHDGGAYWVDEYGNEEAIAGFQVPSLLYVDDQGDAYFRVFLESEGGYRYYMIDVDGGVEYVHADDVPGYYEEPPYDGEYDYPRTIEWDADEGWVIIQDENGHYGKYYTDGTEYGVDEHGNQLPPNGFHLDQGDLLYVDEYGNAYFRGGEEGNYSYYLIDHDGGIEYVQYEDIPGYEDLEEPPYEGHAPYFFDDFANPFYGDIEPDGEPIFANGLHQQTYEDGRIVVTWAQEGGPYTIQYYSEEAGEGYLQLRLTYDAYAYDYEVNVYPYDYFDHVEEDFELGPIDHYVDLAYLDIPYDNMEISNTEVEYYWYDDDGELLQKTTVNRVTGEIVYEYDELYIHVDQYGNEYYEGYPDPNWEPPAGYGEVEDYPPYGMPPHLVFGEGYQYEMEYVDPDEAGYELLSATPADNPNQWQYAGPGGERVIVSKLDEYTYQFVYQSDPNAPPGDWEMVMNVTTDEYGNYISYEAVGGDYYDQYYEPEEDYGNVIPEGAPAYFGEEQWVNPELDERFSFDHTETDDQGAQHYVYVADFDGDGEYDYQIDVVQYPDGHVEVEYYSPEYGHEATFNIITQPNGYYGAYDVTYYVDDPHGVEEYEPVEELYDPAWAEHYAPNYGFEHPYDIYGQPDEPGPNQAPNVYVFGGGRAMVVQNADGSETITWYSEGGYQDGYVEYEATVEYEGGQWVTESVALPTDLIPVYGIWPVEGTPIYDPYNPDAPWGEPDSVTILEDRVIAIWETDEGQIRSEWYRDGSHFREVTYPDGLTISWAGDTWEYEIPDDWTPPEYDDVEPVDFEADALLPEDAPEYFGDPMWINPEHDARFVAGEPRYPEGEDGPVEIRYSGYLGADIPEYFVYIREYPDGRIEITYQDYDGYDQARIEVYQDEYGNYGEYSFEGLMDDPQGVPPAVEEVSVGMSNVETFEADGYLPENAPEYFGDPMWVNPEDDPRFIETEVVDYSADYTDLPEHLVGAIYRSYTADLDGDGLADYRIGVTELNDGQVDIIYYNDNTDEGGAIRVQVDGVGNYVTYGIIGDDPQGVPPYDGQENGAAEPAEAEPELEAWTAHLPPYWNFEIGTGQHENFQNPEAEDQVVEYDLVSSTPAERVYVDQFGQYVRIVNNGGGNYTFSWGEDLSNPELVMSVPYEGNPEIEYTSVGVVDPWTEEEAPPEEESVEELDEAEPVGPEYYISGDYPNPDYLEPERVEGAWSYYNGNTIAVQDHYDGTETVMYGDGHGNFDMIFTRNAETGEILDMTYWPDGGIGVEDEEGAEMASAEDMDAEPADGDAEEEDSDDGSPEPPEAPEPPSEPEGEMEEQLQFLNEDQMQAAAPEGEESLEFNGPETDGEEAATAEPEGVDVVEEVEPVEIAQPEMVEPVEDIEPVTSALVEDDDFADDDFDDDDDDDDHHGL